MTILPSSVPVYVGLGSNDARAPEYLQQALDGLAALEGLTPDGVSPVYCTEPQGYSDQPWFLNQVARYLADPSWTAPALMQAFLDLEARLGRVRSPDPALRFGPRCIDIDMLLFGTLELEHPVVCLPHPRLTERAFWLVPLRDLAPDLVVAGSRVQAHLDRLVWRCEGNRIFQ